MISLQHISKSYSDNKPAILHDFSLEIATGEVVALMGKSGSGKTTLARIIAGIDTDYSGQVIIDGMPLAEYLQLKRVAIVMQNYANFEWMSVLDNVILEKGNRQYALSVLQELGLDQHVNSYPHELSGGQQQRVAVARAIVQESKIIIFDESFSSLDSVTKKASWEYVKKVVQEFGLTALCITHDISEAEYLAGRIITISE